MKLTYRPDVDGLRAIAVLAVLAFHAFPGAAPGGFAGVDVFFVISGFLISGIIFDGLRSGTFSFADFYWRRIRRIFPALALVLTASLVLGWLLLLPDEYGQLGKHVAAGAGFVSNIVLWREAGYFDTAAELKPLLHLWSLGVEEQYYLAWPLLLFLFRERRRGMLRMILALGALSFAANIGLTAERPSAAFYLPVARFWELLAGSTLAYISAYRRGSGKFKNAQSVIGLTLVIASMLLLNAERAFPGWWALLPVLGTALLVSAGPSAWINRNLLARPGMVLIGLISYPLYLWHWPLLTYARIVHGGEPPATVRLALLLASVLLAWLTFELVEKKIRRAKFGRAPRAAGPALVASMTAVGVYGLLALQSYFPPQSATVPMIREITRASTDWEYDGDRVLAGDTSRAVLFFGDSHMQHYWPRIHKIVTERTAPVRTVIFKTSGGCAPVPGIERRGRKCNEFVDEGLKLALQPRVETVVIAASWVGFLDRSDYYEAGNPDAAPLKLLTPQAEWVLQGFEAALRNLVAHGKRVVIVLSSPRGERFDPKSVIHREGMTVQVRAGFAPVPKSALTTLTSPIDARLKRIAAEIGASVIDPADWLCGASYCFAADDLGRPLYKDESHLRASFVRERFEALDRYVYVR